MKHFGKIVKVALVIMMVFSMIGCVQTPSIATVYKGNIIKNLIMDCQSYTKYRPVEPLFSCQKTGGKCLWQMIKPQKRRNSR